MNESKIKIGDFTYTIIGDANVEPVFVDIVLEMSNFDGIVRVAMGCMVFSGEDGRYVQTVCRMRLPQAAAVDLRNALNSALSAPQDARKKAN